MDRQSPSQSGIPRIDVPVADLAVLSFAAPEVNAVSEWVGSLPMANTGETAAKLMDATSEISRLVIEHTGRLELLEVIRPTLHYICARLDRSALNQGTSGENLAQVAQRLQSNLCTGYKSVVLAAVQRKQEERSAGGAIGRDTLPTAIHRALSDLSRNMLRSLQLYVAPGEHLWLELNQLYCLAERLEIMDAKVRDTENHSVQTSTVADAYARALLLATAKPNQLRPRSLSLLFNALELWTSRVIVDRNLTDALFLVDLDADRGPFFQGLDNRPTSDLRCLRTDVLIYELEAYLRQIDSGVPIPDYVSEALLQHLIAAWSKMQGRAHRRVTATGEVKVCIGLRTVHYYLSGGVEFNQQLAGTDSVVRKEVDPFAGDTPSPEPEPGTGRFQIHDTSIIDISPGGYCLRWPDSIPGSLQVGELIAIRERSDTRWCLAIVRWIQQEISATAMGIELLAPRAIPVAARVIQKRGGPSDFARALLLPELSAIEQPATIITPTVPFSNGQKIHVQRQGIQSTAQLRQKVNSSESFNQFTFRLLDGYLENAQIDLNIAPLSEMIGETPTHDD